MRRLPVLAAGVGLTVALVAVADARDWSGLVITLVALGVAAFYVVTILVPWLIREQVMLRTRTYQVRRVPSSNGRGEHVVVYVDAFDSKVAEVVQIHVRESSFLVPETHGLRTVAPAEPRVLTG